MQPSAAAGTTFAVLDSVLVMGVYRTLWSVIFVVAVGCNSDSVSDVALQRRGSQPHRSCTVPDDSGVPCDCPGEEVCPEGDKYFSTCLEDGTWELTHHACALGLNCRVSSDCAAGQACCGEPHIGSWGTQVASSNCWPTSCPADLLPLCQETAQCTDDGSKCIPTDTAFQGDTVSYCKSSN